MPHITIYTTPVCPYCTRAKQLFVQKGVTWEEIDVSLDDHLRTQMIEKAEGRKTVPQIFIAGKHIGGCDDLYALEREGTLDALLGLE